MNIPLSITDIFTRRRTINVDSECPHCHKQMVGQNAIKEIAYRSLSTNPPSAA